MSPIALYSQNTEQQNESIEEVSNSPADETEIDLEEEQEDIDESKEDGGDKKSSEKSLDKDKKANYKEERRQKRLARELASIKDAEKLVFEDDTISIHTNRYGINWLSPFYSYRKVLITNKTDSEIFVTGDIFNKIVNEEAKSKVEQIARQKKEKANNAQNAGAINGGLLGVAVIAGGYAAHKKIDRERISLLNQISEMLKDKPFSLNLSPNEEKVVRFLIPRKKDVDLSFALTYPQEIQSGKLPDNQKFYSSGINEDFAKRFVLEPELYDYAYIDEEVIDKKIGLYFANQPRPKESNRRKSKNSSSENEESIDQSYTKAEPLKTISIEEFKLEISPDNSRRKAKVTYRFPGLTSENVFPAKDFRIFVYQNVKKQPVKEQIEFIKLTVNKKENYRTIVNNQIPFYIKEIKPGVSELRPSGRLLSSGEYLINLKDGDNEKSYIFSITKPQKRTSKK